MNPEMMAKIAEQMAGRSDAASQPGQMPIDMVDADQLPRETALKYEEIALLVGSLYINSHHEINTLKEQFSVIRQQLENKMRDLARENQTLREQLNGQSTGEASSA